MLVSCKSGRVLDVPAHHSVFAPVGNYKEGDLIDPSAVEVEPGLASAALRPGYLFIVDNRVEAVVAVTRRRATTGQKVVFTDDQACGALLR